MKQVKLICGDCGCPFPVEGKNPFKEHKKYCDKNIMKTYAVYQAAQHRMHLTAFGVGMLAFLAGGGICWFMFIR